jgi:gliding motility-associated-like protein
MIKNLLFQFCLLLLTAAEVYSQDCCCGSRVELIFPGFDFEIDPLPAPGLHNTFCAGPMGDWTVTAGCIDHVDKAHFNAGFGNPNGPSTFADLVGSPCNGCAIPGTMQYLLTGLIPGYPYTLEFYYAKFDVPGTFIATVKLDNGNLLNKTWTATNPGNVIWLKASYNFVPQSSSINLEFKDAGSSSPNPVGVLIDDIKIFGCTMEDVEKPAIDNSPDDFVVGCEKDVPQVPKLDISDNCDPKPSVTFTTTTDLINACFKKITREWTVVDKCGNSTVESQIIDIIDEVPVVNNPPKDLEVECDKDIPKPETLDITDNCSVKPNVTLKESFQIIDSCTKIVNRRWTIKDDCNTITEDQMILVSDKNPPDFTKIPERKVIYCENNILKEFNDWITNNGNATAKDDCGPITWRVKYDRLPKSYCDTVNVEFIAIDHCGKGQSEFSTFIVKDTTSPKFVIKAQNKNLVCIQNAKDSLQPWLMTNGFSQVSTDCDTVIINSDFNGDSTQNPLTVTFYARDRCGNIDSSIATFSYRGSNDTFRITNYSCNFLQNSIDTLYYNPAGCDSIVIVEKIKRLADSTYIQFNTCDPSIDFDTAFLVNVNGCDSIIFKEYLFHPDKITNLQVKDCAYLNYSRDTLFLQGEYCDSLVITEYIPLQKSFTSLFKITCDSTQVDTTVVSLLNSQGCDSIITTIINYSQQKITSIEKRICGLQSEYSDTLTISTGSCDSLVITKHIASALDTTKLFSSTCDKTKAGVFSFLKSNQYGCDSLVIEEVLLNRSDSNSTLMLTCVLQDTGTQINTFKNTFGCDSIVRLTIQFIPSDTISVIQKTCIKADVGSDTLILPGSVCDSVIFVNTVFIPSDTTYLSITSCIPGDAGFTEKLLQNAGGCDSIIFITTTFTPLQLIFDLDSISCFNTNDGAFEIVNSFQFKKPHQLYINGKLLGDLDKLTNLGPGFYNIFVRDQTGCNSDSINFTLDNPDELWIDIGNNQEVKKGTKITLNLNSNKTLQNIFWNPPGISGCITCNMVNFIVNEDIWIYAQAIDERGCYKNDSLLIRVKKSTTVYAPNSFTPNGDNINDYFYILGDEKANIEILFIYDRWGNKIFGTFNVPVNQPLYGWNGTFKSQKMNPGVFVYYAKIKKSDDEIVELKGDINLIR